ncbi:hypothetical protein CEN40_17370 [Fischerella thermalis CCMEE 5205]|uniref:hypothetical protein n=1 Tax=Fischerella thermalis TaxID=372787 RepID=UPI000C80B53A|nr:hypothetical protein CEN47_25565 [Fischerella thermalis CCMEE 5319]PMB42693.1 hypothetical protein CEN40_17370 [Fischerella thermalis CCMEE 5205]
MYVQEKLIQHLAAATNLNQPLQGEVKIDNTQVDGGNIPHAKITIARDYFGFIIIWVLFLVFLSRMRRLAQNNKLFFSVQPSHNKVPCRNCHYFSHNHHLKCAVQPSIVLTEEAINCTDYCPKHEKNANKNH